MRNDMQIVVSSKMQSRKLIRDIYRRFQSNHGLIHGSAENVLWSCATAWRRSYSIRKRESPVTTMAWQKNTLCVRRFFAAMVG